MGTIQPQDEPVVKAPLLVKKQPHEFPLVRLKAPESSTKHSTAIIAEFRRQVSSNSDRHSSHVGAARKHSVSISRRQEEMLTSSSLSNLDIPATDAPTEFTEILTTVAPTTTTAATTTSLVDDLTTDTTQQPVTATTTAATVPAVTTIAPTTKTSTQSWSASSNTTEILEDLHKPKTVISELTAPIPEPPGHHHKGENNTTTNNNKNKSGPCDTVSCKGLNVLNDHPLLYIFLLMVLSLLVFLLRKICTRSQNRDQRGEYRAVGRMLASNFDTSFDDEDVDFYGSEVYDDDDDCVDDAGAAASSNGGWSNQSTKGSIELGSIGSDNLTLEEMNG